MDTRKGRSVHPPLIDERHQEAQKVPRRPVSINEQGKPQRMGQAPGKLIDKDGLSRELDNG